MLFPQFGAGCGVPIKSRLPLLLKHRGVSPTSVSASDAVRQRFANSERTRRRRLFNESHSLKSACKFLRTKNQKLEHDPSGTVSLEELEYARQDVRCTADLLSALKVVEFMCILVLLWAGWRFLASRRAAGLP